MLVGPGLLMAGANIGGGEWLFGPLVTARYGGAVLWVATLSITFQVFYNLAIMRYALASGESIFVGFFRTRPGARFWLVVYIVLDLGSYLPYLAANAAVPVNALILGHLPGELPTKFLSVEDVASRTGLPADLVLELKEHPEGFRRDGGPRPLPEPIARWIDGENRNTQRIAYAVFLLSFVPLIFGGKIYNSLERVMITKLALVLGYLAFVAVFLVSWSTKGEILSGFLRFGEIPEGVSWAALAAFAAYAGAGGLSNTSFSNYARDKGWGMGSQVGAIPSAVGGKTIQLSHSGKTFEIDASSLGRWRGWLRHILRDQCLLWAPACLIGMALPCMLSYEFIRGVKDVDGHAAAAMTARAIAERHGGVFWLLTLFCGFAILFPTQISNLDGISRRWTDVMWIGVKRLRRLGGNQVKLVYYALLGIYAVWGLAALALSPNPLVLAVLNGVLMNFGMGFSALHVLYMSLTLLPRELRPPRLMQIGLVGCAIFYGGISALVLRQVWQSWGG